MALSPAEWGDEDGHHEIYFLTEISERLIPTNVVFREGGSWCAYSLAQAVRLVLCSACPPVFSWASVFVSLFHLLFCWAYLSGSVRNVERALASLPHCYPV